MNTAGKTATSTASPGHVQLDKEDGVAWLRISNPTRFNAMSLAMWHQLAQHIQTVGDDPDARVIVVTGVGNRAFVSGADISEFAHLRDSDEQVDAYARAVYDAQSAMVACDTPSIALINGICMGGGIGIALSCDVRVSTASARFRMPAARLGLGYDVEGMRRAVQVMGYANTVDIFFSARTFDGSEALRLGLVNRCFQDEHFKIQAKAVVHDLAGNAPLTLRAAKQALRHILDDTQEGLARAEATIEACFQSEDYREGQAAFKEKRDPKFSGR